MAALALDPLNHAKPLRRVRRREKVLNYLMKLGIGTAKIPTSQSKPDIGNITPKIIDTDPIYMVAAGGSE